MNMSRFDFFGSYFFIPFLIIFFVIFNMPKDEEGENGKQE